MNGNVPAQPRRDVDGNRAGRDTHLSPDPAKGLKGVFQRGLRALRGGD